MMQNRIIDYVRHEITSHQALEMLLRYWQEDRSLPVILIAMPGCAQETVLTIRVALSRERSKYPPEERAYYGFTCSESFPYTVERVRNEAVVLRWSITQLQNLKNTIRSLDDI